MSAGMPGGWTETDIVLPGGWLEGEPWCGTCRNTGQVWSPEPDGTGMYDQACPDCDTPYPGTTDTIPKRHRED